MNVRTPRRSAPNGKNRDNTKEITKTGHLKRLMADPNLRCQVANAMVASLPPIYDGTCFRDIATDMVDVILSTAAELAPRFKPPRGAQGWCAGPGMKAAMNTTCQQREEASRRLGGESFNNKLRTAMTIADKNIRNVRKAAVLSFFGAFVRKLETRFREQANLQAPEDDELGKGVRRQLGVYQRQGRHTPERR